MCPAANSGRNFSGIRSVVFRRSTGTQWRRIRGGLVSEKGQRWNARCMRSGRNGVAFLEFAFSVFSDFEISFVLLFFGSILCVLVAVFQWLLCALRVVLVDSVGGWSWCMYSVCDCCFLLYCCAQSGGPGTTSSLPLRCCSSWRRVRWVLFVLGFGGSWVFCVGPA